MRVCDVESNVLLSETWKQFNSCQEIMQGNETNTTQDADEPEWLEHAGRTRLTQILTFNIQQLLNIHIFFMVC